MAGLRGPFEKTGANIEKDHKPAVDAGNGSQTTRRNIVHLPPGGVLRLNTRVRVTCWILCAVGGVLAGVHVMDALDHRFAKPQMKDATVLLLMINVIWTVVAAFLLSTATGFVALGVAAKEFARVSKILYAVSAISQAVMVAFEYQWRGRVESWVAWYALAMHVVLLLPMRAFHSSDARQHRLFLGKYVEVPAGAVDSTVDAKV